jgi:hypothetical protein
MKYSCIASVARTGVQIGEIMATHELQLTKFSHVFVQYSSFPKCVYLIWLGFFNEINPPMFKYQSWHEFCFCMSNYFCFDSKTFHRNRVYVMCVYACHIVKKIAVFVIHVKSSELPTG